MTGHPLSQEQIDTIIRLFPTTNNKELARITGASKSCIANYARKYHLRKTPEHVTAVHRASGLASAATGNIPHLTDEIITRRAETYKQRYKTEKARRLFGLEQKTKIKIRIAPRDYQTQRYYLRQLGYMVDDREKVAYYDDNTKRAFRLEAKPKKYFSFKPLLAATKG